MNNSPQLLSLLRQFGQEIHHPALLRWHDALEQGRGNGVRLALLDSGIAWHHSWFARANLQAKDFTGSGLADSTGHGTQMASLLVGPWGLIPQATLLFGKVLKATSATQSEVYLARGIHWAIQQQVDILVLPLGRSQPSRQIQTALNRAIDNGIRVFAAAGNRGPDTILFPALLPGVAAVTGADKTGTVLTGCTSGELADCIALGKVLVPSLSASTDPATLVGSSPATAIAAGIAALNTELAMRRERA